MLLSRDDFPELVKRTLGSRVGYRCSRPECRASTSGPQVDASKALNVGVAAHITAAAVGGPRFDPSLSPEQRASVSNGIWLCQNCAKLVDNDPAQFSADLLQSWKMQAEANALEHIGKTAGPLNTTEIVDKWVSFGYEQRTGIAQKLKEQGFDLHWSSADMESERLDVNGYEYVLVDQPDGIRARLKIHDSPAVGGYLVLLKRKSTSQ